MVKITHIFDNTIISDDELKQGVFTIGRGSDNYFQLNDRVISAHHASIVVKRCTYMDSIFNITIEDLKSTNGVFVNGKRVSQKKLKHNDLIQIGLHKFKIYDAHADSAAQTEFYISNI